MNQCKKRVPLYSPTGPLLFTKYDFLGSSPVQRVHRNYVLLINQSLGMNPFILNFQNGGSCSVEDDGSAITHAVQKYSLWLGLFVVFLFS